MDLYIYRQFLKNLALWNVVILRISEKESRNTKDFQDLILWDFILPRDLAYFTLRNLRKVGIENS